MPSKRGKGSHWCSNCGHAKCGHYSKGEPRNKLEASSGHHMKICRKNTYRGCHNTVYDNANADGIMTEWEECRCILEFN